VKLLLVKNAAGDVIKVIPGSTDKQTVTVFFKDVNNDGVVDIVVKIVQDHKKPKFQAFSGKDGSSLTLPKNFKG
jgi:hypothetical protein